MNEKEIRALGFEPWYGGSLIAPEGWDDSEEVLYDNPDGYIKSCKKADSHPWTHGNAGWYNIIGYKKKETPMEYPEWVINRAYELGVDHLALCQHILDHEQPPVDPDLELARKHYDMWMKCEHDCAEHAILAAIKEARNA